MGKSYLEKILEVGNLEDLGVSPFTAGEGKVKISRDDVPKFQEVYNKYILNLKGTEISLLKGTNKIVEVDENYLTRISINGKKSKVPMDVIRYTYEAMVKKPDMEVRRVTDILAYAKANYHSLSSSIVVAVLDQVPFISRVDGSKGIRINLK